MRHRDGVQVAASRNADIQQAAYFHELLTQERDEICDNLDEHRVDLAICEHSGDLGGVRRKRRIIKALEAEIGTINRMLKALSVRLD